ncbi:MAG: SUMF1/EgtB/PvdO family nonheme iron enzyme [Deltaproteobacteria bacterium]|nr:SUMF1/EgtB/PvdO family nonheme iron enzyme [Deltaproteobacteria bacterium]
MKTTPFFSIIGIFLLFTFFSCDDSTSINNCGNGIVDIGEECDMDSFPYGSECTNFGYISGNAQCTSDCRVDVNPCIPSGQCGNGVIQGDEECDGDDIGTATCESEGYISGNLGCKNDCTFDTSTCTLNYTSPNIGTLIYVPGGAFQRDTITSNISTVSSFRISQTEITRSMYYTVWNTDPSDTINSIGTTDPVQSVNWYQAISFCNKLSLLEGLTPVYNIEGVDFSNLTHDQIPSTDNDTWNNVSVNWTADGYRLPTEMEWMWAAMDANISNPVETNTTGYTKYFSGSNGTNIINDYAWFSSNSNNTTHPSGSKTMNELGIYDMSGNVWEWIWDYFAMFPAGEIADYKGPSTGDFRILRGGSWATDQTYCTISKRSYDYADFSSTDIGLRVVRH